MSLVQRIALTVALISLGSGVFTLYLQPSFLVTLAEQIWACF